MSVSGCNFLMAFFDRRTFESLIVIKFYDKETGREAGSLFGGHLQEKGQQGRGGIQEKQGAVHDQ